ncbi:hypothetical protein [Rhizobium sp. 2MFCol3.1]|uniref:hypothetical protein n=1 Tax=Rhizobium sp. 2MFCol3.1 TaxID=1246459 RepID=UPI00037809F9|nr:hypothetical protein [Rhizobium sp. 2MFCol3.1]
MPANRQTERTRTQTAAQFQKGKSGNPAGRTPIPPDVKEAAKAHTMTAIETLVDEMKNGKNGASRVAAATAILNRGWGAPKQTVDVDVNHKQDWSAMLDALDQWNAGKQLTQAETVQVIEATAIEVIETE